MLHKPFFRGLLVVYVKKVTIKLNEIKKTENPAFYVEYSYVDNIEEKSFH